MSQGSVMVDSVVQQAERLLVALSSLCNQVPPPTPTLLYFPIPLNGVGYIVATKENTDVTVECEGRNFLCHSVILKARSMLFFKLLERGSNVIRFDDVKFAVMDDIIKYIYSGQVTDDDVCLCLNHAVFVKVEITAEKLVDTISAAVKFELPTLLEKCFKVFRNQINFDNAADVLILSSKLGLEEFQRVAVTRITNNRAMLVADPGFRTKMLDHPATLLLLYDTLCQADTADTPPPSQSSSVSSPDPESGLWYCVCGNTVTGQCCSWCGYGN